MYFTVTNTMNDTLKPFNYLNGSNHHKAFNFKINSVYLEIYFLIFLFFILIGLILNLIVITTYRFGDRSKVLNNTSTNVNLTHKILSFKSLEIDQINQKQNSINQISIRQRRYTETLYNRMVENMYQQKNHRPSIYINRSSPMKDYNQKDNYQNNNSNQVYVTLPITGPTGAANLNIRRTLCSYFILSLGFCDLTICLFNMPMNLLSEIGFFDLNYFLNKSFELDMCCKITHFLLQIPISLEIEILLMIAVDRYSSVFRSIESYFFDKDKFKLTLMLQLFLSSLLSFPNLIFFTSNKQHFALTNQTNLQTSNESFSSYCIIQEDLTKFYTFYQASLFSLFVLIFIIIMICYIKVYKHVYKASRNQRKESLMTNSSFTSLKRNFVHKDENLNKFVLTEAEEEVEEDSEIKTDNLASKKSMRRISCPIDIGKDLALKSFNTNLLTAQKSHNLKRNSLRYTESIKFKKPSDSTTIIGRIRRLSENTYTNPGCVTNSFLEYQNNATSTISMRRHTSRRFKHGRTARVLGLTTLAFAITWTPYWFYVYKYEIGKHDKEPINGSVLKYLKNSFYLNYILNPIFYSFVNRRFREIFRNLCRKIFNFFSKFCCCCWRNCSRNKENLEFLRANSNFYCSNQSFNTNAALNANYQRRRSRYNSVRSDFFDSSVNSSPSVPNFLNELFNSKLSSFLNCCNFFKNNKSKPNFDLNNETS